MDTPHMDDTELFTRIIYYKISQYNYQEFKTYADILRDENMFPEEKYAQIAPLIEHHRQIDRADMILIAHNTIQSVMGNQDIGDVKRKELEVNIEKIINLLNRSRDTILRYFITVG